MRFTRLSIALVALALSLVPVAHAAPAVDLSPVCQTLEEVVGVVNGVVDNVESKLLIGRADSTALAPPTSSTTSPATTSTTLATSPGSAGATTTGINLSTVSSSIPQASPIQLRRQLPPLLSSLVPPSVPLVSSEIQSTLSTVVSKSVPSKPTNT